MKKRNTAYPSGNAANQERSLPKAEPTATNTRAQTRTQTSAQTRALTNKDKGKYKTMKKHIRTFKAHTNKRPTSTRIITRNEHSTSTLAHRQCEQRRTQQRKNKLIHAQERKQMFYPLSHKGDINVKTETDCETCIIYGCAVLPSDKLVLTDYYNKKLKLVDTWTKELVEEKQLDSSPFDVAVLPEDEIAVTIPANEEILIIKPAGQLSTSRSIKVQGRCRGITYRHDRLYVVCAKTFVLILDMKGNVKDRISLEDETKFSSPYYIALNKNETLLYISDHITDTVASVTVQGKISAVYKDIKDPLGIVMLDDESLLICCFDKSIYHLQADMKQSCEILSGLKKPTSICWSSEKSEVYVGCEICDQLKVFSLQ